MNPGRGFWGPGSDKSLRRDYLNMKWDLFWLVKVMAYMVEMCELLMAVSVVIVDVIVKGLAV